MAIQMRRGNYANFDETKLIEGEFAVCLDNGYVFVKCGSAGTVQLGTADTIAEALEMAREYVEDAEAWAIGERNGTPVTSDDDTYENNAKYYAGVAEDSASSASADATTSSDKALDSEAWAKGTRNGVDVPSTDPTYHNNAKYYAEEASVGDVPIATTSSIGVVKPDGSTITIQNDGTISSTSTGVISGGTTGQVLAKHSNTDQDVEWVTPVSTVEGLTDTAISSLTDGQALVYDSDSQKWVNGTVSGGDATWETTTGKPFSSVNSDDFRTTNDTLAIPVPHYYVEVNGDNLSGTYQTSAEPIVLPDGCLSKPFELTIKNIGTTKTWKNGRTSVSPSVFPTESYYQYLIYVKEQSSNTVYGICAIKLFGQSLVVYHNKSNSLSISLNVANSTRLGGEYTLRYNPLNVNPEFNYFIGVYNTYEAHDGARTLKSEYGIDINGTNVSLKGGTNSHFYILYTYEYNASTMAYRGHHATFIVAARDNNGWLTPVGIPLASSSNTGVSVTYSVSNSIPIVTIKASASTYNVDYKILEVGY